MKKKQNRHYYSEILKMGVLCVLVPTAAFAAPKIFRTILPCILDIANPQEGEMTVDYAANTLRMKLGGVLRNLAQETSPSKIRFPEIVETTQTVVFKTSGFSIKFTDGMSHTFFADTLVDRIQFSYGLGGVPMLQAGWVNTYVIPAPSNPGQAALAFQMEGASSRLGSDGISRYVGSFYLQANASCAGSECSTSPTLPAGCQDYSIPNACPTAYGRLAGVPLRKTNGHYEYSIVPTLLTTSVADHYQVQNISSFANRVRFFSPQEVDLEAGFPTTLTAGSGWVAVDGPALHVDGASSAVNGVRMVGHEESESWYE